jgi:hypothetical protein
MRVCGILDKKSHIFHNRKSEVFPNRIFRPHGYWAEKGGCRKTYPDEKGIETADSNAAADYVKTSYMDVK